MFRIAGAKSYAIVAAVAAAIVAVVVVLTIALNAGAAARVTTPAPKAPRVTASVPTYAVHPTYCAPLAKLIALGPVNYMVGTTLTGAQMQYADAAFDTARAARADGRKDVAAMFDLDVVRIWKPANSDAGLEKQAAEQTDFLGKTDSTVRADCNLSMMATGD